MKHWKEPWREPRARLHRQREAGFCPIYSSRWTRVSRQVRATFPLCQRCKAKPSMEVHHKVPANKAPWLFFDPSNLMAVCRPCHEALEAEALPK